MALEAAARYTTLVAPRNPSLGWSLRAFGPVPAGYCWAGGPSDPISTKFVDSGTVPTKDKPGWFYFGAGSSTECGAVTAIPGEVTTGPPPATGVTVEETGTSGLGSSDCYRCSSAN